MPKHLTGVTFILFLFSSFALAQSPTQRPSGPPNTQAAPDQLTPQVLGEMLRSATTFHELVMKMNLNKSLGPDQHIQGPDGQLHHPLTRTAETLGAGAGVGAAIGAMSRSQNGVLIGALVGGVGGLIIDQIVQHREELRVKAISNAAPDTSNAPFDPPRRLIDRSHDSGRQPN